MGINTPGLESPGQELMRKNSELIGEIERKMELLRQSAAEVGKNKSRDLQERANCQVW